MLADALEHLIKGIVDDPEEVEVRSHSGRVIGRNGRTAKSVRTVIGALAEDEQVKVDIVDTDRR